MSDIINGLLAEQGQILAAERWLRKKHTSLWSHFDLTDEEEIREAAIWFLGELAEFLEERLPRLPGLPSPTIDQHEFAMSLQAQGPFDFGPEVEGLPGTGITDPEWRTARNAIRAIRDRESRS